ncbi:MAG: hypothetical protein HY010_04805 [Acidobacteria bacterium]|nr:hypothetical protein [Acidobacteriota bacterium]
MTKTSRIMIVIVMLTAASWGQSLFAVQVKGKQRWPAEEANHLYLSACSAVQQQFGGVHAIRPQVTLVLGADQDGAFWDTREIRLTKWNPYLFAEGVVIFAMGDLVKREQAGIARRAVMWSDSTVDIKETSK